MKTTNRYVHITKEEFDEFTRRLSFIQVYEPGVLEVIYERVSKNGQARIRIYSTISLAGGSGRKKGGDSIKVTLQVLRNGKWEGAGKKFKRVHRTKNWKDNIKDRIRQAASSVHTDVCPECGAALVKRDGEFGCFFSCVMWSDTGCKGKASCRSES